MNHSVTNFYAQKFFKENADGFAQGNKNSSRKNFSAKRNFDEVKPLTDAQKGAYIHGMVYGASQKLPSDEEFIATWQKFNKSTEPVIQKYCQKAESLPSKDAKSLFALGASFAAGASAIDKDRWAKLQEKFTKALKNKEETVASAKEEAVASAEEFSRRPAKNFADDANKDALKKANQAAAVQACCGSHKVEVMAKAEGYAQGIKSYAGEDKQEIKDIAKKFLEGKKLDEKEALKLFGKIFPNK